MGWYYYAAMAAIKIAQGMQQGQSQDNMARGMDRNAEAAQAAGYANEQRTRDQNTYRLGAQRAAAAESGFDSNSGSMVTMQDQSAGNAELDALTERYKGQLQATMYRNQAAEYRVAGKEARIGGFLGAAGTMVGGAAGGASGSTPSLIPQSSPYW